MQTVRYLLVPLNPGATRFQRGGDIHVQGGFQLLELLIALAVISVLTMVAFPMYTDHRDKVNDGVAAGDIAAIVQRIERFYTENNRYPDSLDEVGAAKMQDPWEHNYQYLRINGAGLKSKAALRKDKNLVPINTDYDLYSSGKDGTTFPPLTAKNSQDDIIRANNGKFIGLAADY